MYRSVSFSSAMIRGSMAATSMSFSSSMAAMARRRVFTGGDIHSRQTAREVPESTRCRAKRARSERRYSLIFQAQSRMENNRSAAPAGGAMRTRESARMRRQRMTRFFVSACERWRMYRAMPARVGSASRAERTL